MTALATVGFGLVPAIQGSRVDLMTLMKDSRATSGRQRSRLRSALLVVQVALACVLLIAAGLLFRSLQRVSALDVGFDPDRVVIATLNLQPLGYDPARSTAFFDEILRRTRALPGVERAALADFVPMGSRGSSVAFEIPRPERRERVPARRTTGFRMAISRRWISHCAWAATSRSARPRPPHRSRSSTRPWRGGTGPRRRPLASASASTANRPIARLSASSPMRSTCRSWRTSSRSSICPRGRDSGGS